MSAFDKVGETELNLGLNVAAQQVHIHNSTVAIR